MLISASERMHDARPVFADHGGPVVARPRVSVGAINNVHFGMLSVETLRADPLRRIIPLLAAVLRHGSLGASGKHGGVSSGTYASPRRPSPPVR